MNEAKFWQDKIIQLFHDPTDKVLHLFRDGKHTDFAQELLDTFIGKGKAWLGRPNEAKPEGYRVAIDNKADRVSTGADRPVIGSTVTRVDWWKYPEISHPLDGTPLNWNEEGTPLNWQKWDENAVRESLRNELSTNAIQNWDDPTELSMKFLWVWRCLPLQLMKQHGPLWSVLPADSRIPDHSIWDHLRMASAYAGAKNHPHFFIFAIGSVQTFIYQARTSRDLWIGSYLLADLTWASIQPLAEEYGPDAILYPSLNENPLADQWLISEKKVLSLPFHSTRSSMLPHKFVALLPQKALEGTKEPDGPTGTEVMNNIGEQCRQAVEKRWQYLAAETENFLLKKVGDGHWREIWKGQIQGFPSCRWVAIPWQTVESREKGFAGWFSGQVWQRYELARSVYKNTKPAYVDSERGFDYALTHHKSQLVYRSRKAIGDFTQQKEPGIKCSICGEREVLHNLPDDGSRKVNELRRAAKDFWSNKKLDPDEKGSERLCGVCAFKRYLTEAKTKLNQRWNGDSFNQEGPAAPFPSTSTIAALPFLLKLVEKAEEVQKEIDGFIKAFDAAFNGEAKSHKTLHLSGLPSLKEKVKKVNDSPQKELLEDFFQIDAEYLFSEIWETKIRDAPDDKGQLFQTAKEKAEELIKSVRKASGDCPPPSRHFALLMMDGDNMGKLLLGADDAISAAWKDVLHLKAIEKIKENLSETGWLDLLKEKRLIGPALHAFISRALASFAYEVVPYLVEDKYDSRLIYAGGDDLLVMSSAEKVLDLARELQQHFSSAFLTGNSEHGFTRLSGKGPATGRIIPMLGQHASLSASIIIAHHKQPLQPLLTRGRNILHDLAKEKLERSSVVISVFTRSGEKVIFGGKWVENHIDLVEVIKSAVKAFQEGYIPGRLPYKLQEILPALTATDDPDVRKKLLRRELETSRKQKSPEEQLVAEKHVSATEQIIEQLLELGWIFAKKAKAKKAQMQPEVALNGLLLTRFLGSLLEKEGKE